MIDIANLQLQVIQQVIKSRKELWAYNWTDCYGNGQLGAYHGYTSMYLTRPCSFSFNIALYESTFFPGVGVWIRYKSMQLTPSLFEGEEHSNYIWLYCMDRQFASYISRPFQSKSQCKAFHMETSFIDMQMLVHLHANKTHFHMKGFAPGLTLKQRRKATWKLPIVLPWFQRH